MARTYKRKTALPTPPGFRPVPLSTALQNNLLLKLRDTFPVSTAAGLPPVSPNIFLPPPNTVAPAVPPVQSSVIVNAEDQMSIFPTPPPSPTVENAGFPDDMSIDATSAIQSAFVDTLAATVIPIVRNPAAGIVSETGTQTDVAPAKSSAPRFTQTEIPPSPVMDSTATQTQQVALSSAQVNTNVAALDQATQTVIREIAEAEVQTLLPYATAQEVTTVAESRLNQAIVQYRNIPLNFPFTFEPPAITMRTQDTPPDYVQDTLNQYTESANAAIQALYNEGQVYYQNIVRAQSTGNVGLETQANVSLPFTQLLNQIRRGQQSAVDTLQGIVQEARSGAFTVGRVADAIQQVNETLEAYVRIWQTVSSTVEVALQNGIALPLLSTLTDANAAARYLTARTSAQRYVNVLNEYDRENITARVRALNKNRAFSSGARREIRTLEDTLENPQGTKRQRIA